MIHSNLSQEAEERILAALASRKKIEAIKIYRETTGLGLKESKEAVEAMQQGATSVLSPEKSSQNKPGVESRGCGPSAATILLIAAVLFAAWRLPP